MTNRIQNSLFLRTPYELRTLFDLLRYIQIFLNTANLFLTFLFKVKKKVFVKFTYCFDKLFIAFYILPQLL